MHAVEPGPSDALAAELCLRRGASFRAPYEITQEVLLDGVVHLESLQTLHVPLVTPDGWFVIAGEAYEPEPLVAQIAGRLPGWLAERAAAVREAMPEEPPARALDVFLDVSGADRVFAPQGARPIAPRRARPAAAEVDGTAIPLACGGVLVWPAEGDDTRARAYLARDGEDVIANGPVRTGDPLFGPSPCRAVAFDATVPIDVGVRAGDTIDATDIVARADGRTFVAGLAGTIKRIEHHELGRPLREDRAIAEIRAAAEQAYKHAVARRLQGELTGRRVPSRLVDDDGAVLFQKGAALSFSAPPAWSELIVLAIAFEELEPILMEVEDRLAALPTLTPPPWLAAGRHEAEHRVRFVIE